MRWWLLLLLVACHSEPPAVRIATFNIEDFPKNPVQVRGAFGELEETHASIIAVQEIDDPAVFARAAHQYLGASWQFVPTGWTKPYPHSHHLGVVFDTARWHLVSTTVHPETSLDGYAKPTLEVQLSDAGGERIRVLVVHLVSGTDGLPARRRQHAALAQILARIPRGDHTVVLGDFNATELEDREALRALGAGRFAWATAPLACSAFWRRADSCPRSRLDHALTWRAPRDVEALGACKRDGCDAQDRCPVYATEVSDHCPVVITL